MPSEAAKAGAVVATASIVLSTTAWLAYTSPFWVDASALDATAPERAAPARVASSGQPNVVVIIGCTLRRDQITPYGGHKEASPFLQEVADQGALFESAIDAAPWTKAASTALLTGFHPIQVGMIEPAENPNRRRLSDEVTTLAEYMSAGGYETIGLTANPNTNLIFGLAQGFTDYYEASELWGKAGMTKVGSRRMGNEALKMIDARAYPEAPLYLQAMLIDVHEPLDYSKAQARRFMDDKVPQRVGEYRHALHVMDGGIRKLWEGLNERGFTFENTILIVVNDHGEGLSFPKHHGHGHGNQTFDSTVAMPWIVAGPSVASGHRIGGMASQVDVVPTVLGMVGVVGDYDGPGQDWSAQLQGAPRTTRSASYVDTFFQRANRAAVYTEAMSCHHDFGDVKPPENMERRSPPTACYDRKVDRYQRNPLQTQHKLLDELTIWRTENLEVYANWPHLEDVRGSVDLTEQLEALGYVQD